MADSRYYFSQVNFLSLKVLQLAGALRQLTPYPMVDDLAVVELPPLVKLVLFLSLIFLLLHQNHGHPTNLIYLHTHDFLLHLDCILRLRLGRGQHPGINRVTQSLGGLSNDNVPKHQNAQKMWEVVFD